MTDEKKDWSFVDRHLEKRKRDSESPLPQPIEQGSGVGGEAIVPRPSGVIENFQAARVERKARIEALTIEAKGRLDVWAHQVKQTVLVSKRKIDVQVESQLEQIWRQHLDNLREIGISNYEDRVRALKELTQRTTDQLKQIQDMDVPESMKSKVMDAAIKGYEDLFERIQSEEIAHQVQKP